MDITPGGQVVNHFSGLRRTNGTRLDLFYIRNSLGTKISDHKNFNGVHILCKEHDSENRHSVQKIWLDSIYRCRKIRSNVPKWYFGNAFTAGVLSMIVSFYPLPYQMMVQMVWEGVQVGSMIIFNCSLVNDFLGLSLYLVCVKLLAFVISLGSKSGGSAYSPFQNYFLS